MSPARPLGGYGQASASNLSGRLPPRAGSARGRFAYCNFRARGVKSLADDFAVRKGPVSSRVALLLRSAEGKPSLRPDFHPLQHALLNFSPPPREFSGPTRRREEGGGERSRSPNAEGLPGQSGHCIYIAAGVGGTQCERGGQQVAGTGSRVLGRGTGSRVYRSRVESGWFIGLYIVEIYIQSEAVITRPTPVAFSRVLLLRLLSSPLVATIPRPRP